MHLVSCARPSGPLERAPRTSLRVNTDAERWDGFWSVVDEAYYARCTHPDGGEEWFCYVEEPNRGPWIEPVRRRLGTPTRVDSSGRRVMLLLTKSVGQRGGGVLVGSAHRKAR
jgi:hypothetical protein